MFVTCFKYFCGFGLLNRIRFRKLKENQKKISEDIEEYKINIIECDFRKNYYGYSHFITRLEESNRMLNNIDYNLSKCNTQIKKYSLVKPLIQSKLRRKKSA